MRYVKKRIWSGAVLEQIVYPISDNARSAKTAAPRLRFKTEEDRIKHREGIARRRYAELFNANFGVTSVYSTLTFNDKNEVFSFREARQIRAAFLRRLKYAYPDAVITLVMGRGEHTHRIHFHMVSEGIPKVEIMRQWIYGEIARIENLRAENWYKVNGILQNQGKDYSGLANYLFDHWTVEQGGHHYYFTRNRVEPEEEEPKEIKRSYTVATPPRAPEGYKLVEVKHTDYGYIYFKYVFLNNYRS